MQFLLGFTHFAQKISDNTEDNMAAYTTIDDPSAHFQAAIYEGTTSTRKTVTNTGNSDLKPGLFWFKNRDGNAPHVIADTNRGANNADGGYTIVSNPNSTATEIAEAKGIMTITSNGFTVEEMTSAAGNVNTASMVCWQWKGSGQGTGVGTDVSESGDNPGFKRQTNATAGFSTILYTGTGAVGTIAHGLNSAPSVLLVKSGSTTANWMVKHPSTTNNYDFSYLNTTGGLVANDGAWTQTDPTSTVFSIGASNAVNQDTKGYIAYVWAEVQGYSKFARYTGNGNANGPFVPLGFKPAWLMIKQVSDGSSGDGWLILDNTRDPHNVNSGKQFADTATNDNTGAAIGVDFLSNGFKVRATDGGLNANTKNYIFFAFAAQPFVTSTGISATAN